MLDDRPSCPRSRPGRLSFDEVRLMGDMVQSPDYRHMSIRALALYAPRVGRVFAHPITWGRLIRERGWRRPRLRLYPARPKVGVKATAPDEIWHIDASVLGLLDGTRVYLHAVIDNYSRRILASCVEERLNPMNTRPPSRMRNHEFYPTRLAQDSLVQLQRVKSQMSCGAPLYQKPRS